MAVCMTQMPLLGCMPLELDSVDVSRAMSALTDDEKRLIINPADGRHCMVWPQAEAEKLSEGQVVRKAPEFHYWRVRSVRSLGFSACVVDLEECADQGQWAS